MAAKNSSPYANLIDRAMATAALAHNTQRRKSSPTPYIAHPAMVAFILQRCGFNDTVIAAALLHDVVEDTPTTFENLRTNFGHDVADLVSHVTEHNKGLPWEERKKAYIDGLRNAPAEALAIAAADKLHNMQDTLRSLHEAQQQGHPPSSVWSRFSRPATDQLGYYQRVQKILERRVGQNPEFRSLVRAYNQALQELEEKVGHLKHGS